MLLHDKPIKVGSLTIVLW